MEAKELKRLSRAELIEMLIAEEREIQKLREENKNLKAQIEDRTIAISKAGSIAEAALALNDIFSAAQAAAEQYIENIQNTESKCTSALREAERKAESIIISAKKEAARIEADTKRSADAYWDKLREKLDAYYESHKELKALVETQFGKG